MKSAEEEEKFFRQTLHPCLPSLLEEDDDDGKPNTQTKTFYFTCAFRFAMIIFFYIEENIHSPSFNFFVG
jgi:hypothetical protein